VIKVANAIMGKLEISHPQVLSSIIGGGDHYTSDSFHILLWGQFDNFFGCALQEDTDNDVQLSDADSDSGGGDDENRLILSMNNDDITASNQVLDYMHRCLDPKFQDMCLYNFTGTTTKQLFLVEIDGRFASIEHPQFKSHRLRIKSDSQVPVILGPSLPRCDRTAEEKDRWCRAMLILFKPWNDPKALKNIGQSWADAFTSWTFSAHASSIMKNMNVLNECKDARDRDRSKYRRKRKFRGNYVEYAADSSDVLEHFALDIERDDSLDRPEIDVSNTAHDNLDFDIFNSTFS
jgi:hypothetical protein